MPLSPAYRPRCSNRFLPMLLRGAITKLRHYGPSLPVFPELFDFPYRSRCFSIIGSEETPRSPPQARSMSSVRLGFRVKGEYLCLLTIHDPERLAAHFGLGPSSSYSAEGFAVPAHKHLRPDLSRCRTFPRITVASTPPLPCSRYSTIVA